MVPPIRNAKSVCFTMLTIGFMVDIYYNLYIYIVNGAFEPTHKTGGHHWIGWKSIVLTLELLGQRFVFLWTWIFPWTVYIYIYYFLASCWIFMVHSIGRCCSARSHDLGLVSKMFSSVHKHCTVSIWTLPMECGPTWYDLAAVWWITPLLYEVAAVINFRVFKSYDRGWGAYRYINVCINNNIYIYIHRNRYIHTVHTCQSWLLTNHWYS